MDRALAAQQVTPRVTVVAKYLRSPEVDLPAVGQAHSEFLSRPTKAHPLFAWLIRAAIDRQSGAPSAAVEAAEADAAATAAAVRAE